MKKFLCIVSNDICKKGQWFLGPEIGEPLFKARLTAGPRGAHITQTSAVGIPFDLLANYIIEPGFKYNPEALDRVVSMREDMRRIEQFQSDHEEIIEEEVERRGREENPTLTGKDV